MTQSRRIALGSAFASVLIVGVMSAATSPGDLSKYRKFRLGTNLSIVSKQAGANLSEVKIIHRLPALIQELEWRPEVIRSGAQTEVANQAILRFYDAQLYLIVVSYDRYNTEGLTDDDVIDAISLTYGLATKRAAAAKTVSGRFGDLEELVAEWQDPEHRFELIRSSYGPSYKLVGVLKRLEVPAQAAIIEAKPLDEQEAPQREAVRKASEEEAERAKLEKVRLVNKPKFRP